MILLDDRAILSIQGEDKFHFLQGLMTQDMRPLESGEAEVVYSALLTPQGKIRFDCFLFAQDDHLLMDVATAQLEDVQKILKLYTLRAKVKVEEQPEFAVVASLIAQPELPADPRLEAMGHRGILRREALVGKSLLPKLTYDAHRISFGVPDSIDFIPDRAFPAEYGLHKLNGVSFTKGCYVGQEVVARTQHRGSVHKTLHLVECDAADHLPVINTPILAGETEIGTLRSSVENQGLAILRHEKLAGTASVTAGDIPFTAITPPEWFA